MIFKHAFYITFGKKHKYNLESYIKAFILQKIFALSYDSQLIFVLKCSDELRNVCGCDSVPNASYFTRFKQKYCDYIAQLFHKLVEITEPILGDASLDSYDNYTMLKNDFSFKRVCIPLNKHNSKNSDSSFDEDGTPVCSLDKTPFSFLGKSGGDNRSLRFKWVCSKSIHITTRI
ncbi:MAG: transposase [Firmicutes bacterium]|nr:transposase [Bacillota bacterium]